MLGFASRLFGPDPKLEFRKPGSGVSLLAGPVIDPEDPYWAQYWLLFDSPSEVLTLLDSSSLAHALQRQPTNLHTLVLVLHQHLLSLLSLPPNAAVDVAKELLNCIRVLSRIVPFLLASDALAAAVFWTADRAPSPAPTPEGVRQLGGQFVIDDEDEDEQPEEKESLPKEEGPGPLAPRILALLVDLCFVPGFTVAEECRTSDGPISYVIWEPGIAAPPSALPPTPPSLLSARLEVLRLLILLLSLPSLQTPSPLFTVTPNPWRTALVSSATLERKVVLCLLCSVLNTAFASGGSGEAAGGGRALGSFGGIVGAGGRLVEGMVGMGREDVKGLLTGLCLQFLGIVFCVHASEDDSLPSHVEDAPGLASPFVGGEPTPTTPSGPPANAFAHYLSKLHRSTDFAFLFSGLLNLFQAALATPLLPVGVGGAGQRQSGWALEALVVLWRAMELNSKFVAWLIASGKVGEVQTWLLVFCLEGKEDETQMGLVRLAAFMLQTLTSIPGAEAQLNAPVELKPALKTKHNATTGTVGDFLIVSISTLIFTTRARLSSLYPTLLLSITNVSPHLTGVSVVASTRLLQLFLAFSKPGFLLMEEGNPRLVFYLLEAFNNVIHFQLAANPNLIYAIIRAHKRFEELSTFTLSSGVAEVRRVRLEKKAASAASATALSPVASPPPVEVPMKEMGRKKEEEGDEEVSVKARGKMRERSVSNLHVEGLGMAELRVEEAPRSSNEVEDVFVGKHGFVPTEGWVASWREGLPLDSILILLAELRPKLFDLATLTPEPSAASLTYLSSASIASSLPSVPPPRSRPFVFSPQSVTWFASLLYGSVFLVSLDFLRDVTVELFGVAEGKGRGRGAGELVSGAAAFVLSRVGSGKAGGV